MTPAQTRQQIRNRVAQHVQRLRMEADDLRAEYDKALATPGPLLRRFRLLRLKRKLTALGTLDC